MKRLLPILLLPFAIFLLLTNCTRKNPTPIVDPTDTIPTLGLKDLNPRILIGAPLEISRGNEKYQGIIKTEFSTGQSLWYPAWGGWMAEKQYDFKEFNANVNWMKANNISPTMHMLVGPNNYMPDWLLNGNWQNAQLDSLLRGMIHNIMDTNDNKTKVDVWNVANELFDDDGTYRTNMIWRQLGWENDKSGLVGDAKINTRHPIFIHKAFTYCREKTAKKLEIRDFNIESDDPTTQNYRKNKALFQLVKHMINAHIPIDAVGIQGHLSIGKNDWIFDKNMLLETVKKYKSLGVEVYITELDVRTDNRNWNTLLAEQQKQDYYNYVKQAIEGGANRINFWGLQDGFDPFWLLTEHPLLWTENFEEKPAYFGVKSALNATK